MFNLFLSGSPLLTAAMETIEIVTILGIIVVSNHEQASTDNKGGGGNTQYPISVQKCGLAQLNPVSFIASAMWLTTLNQQSALIQQWSRNVRRPAGKGQSVCAQAVP